MENQKSIRIVMERQVSFDVEKKTDKESPGKRGDSPLHLAARIGNLGKVKELIEKFDGKGIKSLLSLQNQQGETALYVAAENGHTLVVTEMLKYLDLQIASLVANNGYDAFQVAAKQGHLGKSSNLKLRGQKVHVYTMKSDKRLCMAPDSKWSSIRKTYAS